MLKISKECVEAVADKVQKSGDFSDELETIKAENLDFIESIIELCGAVFEDIDDKQRGLFVGLVSYKMFKAAYEGKELGDMWK